MPAACTDSGSPVSNGCQAGQLPVIRQPAVGAAVGQPVERLWPIDRQQQAVDHLLGAIRVVGATAGVDIKQPAGNIRDRKSRPCPRLRACACSTARSRRRAPPTRRCHLGQGFAFPVLILHRHALCDRDRKIAMKAVFLDYATMGPDLDRACLPCSPSSRNLCDRRRRGRGTYSDVEFVLTNKVRLPDRAARTAKNCATSA